MRVAMVALALMAAGEVGATPPIMPAEPPPQPPVTAEALEWGQKLAARGDFHAVIGAMGQAQTEELVRDTPGLSAAERDRLRQVAQRRLSAMRSRLTRVVGEIYARRFSLEDLKAIVAFFESPAGRAYTGAFPRTLPEIATALQGIDFKREVLADFCRETGKGCSNPE